MKTKLLIFSFVIIALGSLSARVRTVCNAAITGGAPNAGLRYTNLQTALDSAHVGDTIYVVGSQTDYGSITIPTRVTLIGAGYNVTGTQYNYNSIVDQINIDSTSNTGDSLVSGTRIMGMVVNNYLDNSATAGINNIDIERCYVGYYLYINGNNWTIRNNIIANLNCNGNNVTWNNIYIQNNFVSYITNSSSTSVIIDHNNFVTNGNSCFYYVTNAIISNNIFWACRPDNGSNVSGNNFSNNVTTNTSLYNLPPANNVGSGDTATTTSFFNDPTISVTTFNQNTIWNYNWKTFKAASKINNRATDGTNPGVYGGSYPMPNLSGAGRIPQMVNMNVSGVAPAGGNLNVNFKAKVQN